MNVLPCPSLVIILAGILRFLFFLTYLKAVTRAARYIVLTIHRDNTGRLLLYRATEQYEKILQRKVTLGRDDNHTIKYIPKVFQANVFTQHKSSALPDRNAPHVLSISLNLLDHIYLPMRMVIMCINTLHL